MLAFIEDPHTWGLVSDGVLVMSAKTRKAFHNSKTGGKASMTETRRNRSLDALAEFDVFDKSILPQLKKMVLENWAPDRIRKAFAPIMQAQMIKKGLAGEYKAIKDTLDRHEGTAIQRIESKTVYAQMSKKELAALALQKLLDAKIIDTTGRVIRDLPEKDSDEDA